MAHRVLHPAIAALALIDASHARADILLDQPFDGRHALPSEQDTAIPFARMADDFSTVATTTFLTEIVVWMSVTFPDDPAGFGLELYAANDMGEGPGVLLSNAFTVSRIVDRGQWDEKSSDHLFEIHFDGGLYDLAAGRYWFSPYAIGNGGEMDRGRRMTGGDETKMVGSEGYFISPHFGFDEWTSTLHEDLLGPSFPADFAMRIEVVIPAPGITGTLGVLGLIGVVGRSRRRGA